MIAKCAANVDNAEEQIQICEIVHYLQHYFFILFPRLAILVVCGNPHYIRVRQGYLIPTNK